MKDIPLVPFFGSVRLVEAEEIRCLLEGHGLHAVVLGGNTVQQGALYGSAFGEARVMVPQDQLDAARQVLRSLGRWPGAA
jgi:hypothetical protein